MTTEDKPLAGLVAVVTGASRGIGRACAFGLAQAGAHVIATGRTQGALEELDDEIKAGKAIDRLGAAIYERWGKLDILVHAAGDLGQMTPVAHLDPSTWDRTISVNMTAAYRLIRSFDPLFRRAAAARPIFITSGIARRPRALWGPYAASKAGLEALVRCYADEMENTPVRPVLLDPGIMRTRMRAAAFPGEDAAQWPEPEAIIPLIVDLARPDRTPDVLVQFQR